MADSLFDNRYRYDYIYPRGRSGETLRAVDTQDNNRPVVIKRPASNDAPPIRAGQEVSILNERKALTRLAGHPVLTALLGSGQFYVGGMTHQYMVMERGTGIIIADAVLELATRGERLPELEMLVIIDHLLDLLYTAHAHDIVYNDVDAKHLFWDRELYRLKVIDWGNAVFLEGDEITPQGISRQSDIFQVGELLYFILTGGGRADIPRNAGEDFKLDFGDDSERVSPRMQGIVSRAVHPNLKLRYRAIGDLRKDLTEYRGPLERERNALIGRVTDRLRHNRSKDELQAMLGALEPALQMDPGYPPAQQAQQDIFNKLHELDIAADLDAARIYMESANWSRAVDLLDELRQGSRGALADQIGLLQDIASLMLHTQDIPREATPPTVLDAIVLIYEGQAPQAAHLLMTQGVANDRIRALQWLIAERIDAYLPDVLLLRPNLYHLEIALAQLAAEGLPLTEPRALLVEIQNNLNEMALTTTASMIELRDGHRVVVDQLTALSTLLENVNAQQGLPDQRLPLSSLDRALNAAMALADNMHVIGRQATASPRDALAALDNSRAIDPTNGLWDAVAKLLDSLYELLGSYQTYVPAADGSDLEGWLKDSKRDLSPFLERLFDEMLVGMVEGLDIAANAWSSYADAAIQGNRIGAITAIAQATDAVATISPTLAGWFNQLRNIITNAQYVERHALYGGLGRALADGWEMFDRGKLSDAERLGQQGYDIARTDAERFAALRLRDVSEAARLWVERNGVNSTGTTQTTLDAVEKLYTTEENNVRNSFASQMPSKETYLRAMGKGLVEIYARSGTAATRILFFNYILIGTLDAHDGNLDDARFWREAAVKAMGKNGGTHIATRTLDEFIERRRDINTGETLLNQIDGAQALSELDTIRKQLEDNAQAKTLMPGIQSLRELQNALRDWSDGEFRAAGLKLENAINFVNEVEQAAVITLTGYRTLLMGLQGGAAELYTKARAMQQVIERKPAEPVDLVRTTHERQVIITEQLLGEEYAATLSQWYQTYESFLNVYSDSAMRRSAKLARFSELFRAMFIDRHPAYPLYRHWYDLTDRAPEFPAPPTDEPQPRITEGEDVAPEEYRGSRYADPEEGEAPVRQRGGIPRIAVFAVVGVVLLGVIGFVAVNALNQNDDTPAIAVTISDTPTVNATGTAVAALALSETRAATEEITPTRITPTQPRPTVVLSTPSLVPSPVLVGPGVTAPAGAEATNAAPTTPAPSVTENLPTATPTLSQTPTPSPTLTPTLTLTLPPQGLQGKQDLLALAAGLTETPWTGDQFNQNVQEAYWRMGIGEGDGPGAIFISIPPELLEARYGSAAASRIRRAEATLTLITFNPALLTQGEGDQVFFGAMMQSVENPAQAVGLQVQVAQPGVINVGQRNGETVNIISQRSVNGYIVRVRLERNEDNGDISVFFNEEQLGQPMDFTAPEAPIIPVLFVKNGGAIVHVTDWTVTLR
jgi:hypothetical protein